MAGGLPAVASVPDAPRSVRSAAPRRRVQSIEFFEGDAPKKLLWTPKHLRSVSPIWSPRADDGQGWDRRLEAAERQRPTPRAASGARSPFAHNMPLFELTPQGATMRLWQPLDGPQRPPLERQTGFIEPEAAAPASGGGAPVSGGAAPASGGGGARGRPAVRAVDGRRRSVDAHGAHDARDAQQKRYLAKSLGLLRSLNVSTSSVQAAAPQPRAEKEEARAAAPAAARPLRMAKSFGDLPLGHLFDEDSDEDSGEADDGGFRSQRTSPSGASLEELPGARGEAAAEELAGARCEAAAGPGRSSFDSAADWRRRSSDPTRRLPQFVVHFEVAANGRGFVPATPPSHGAHFARRSTGVARPRTVDAADQSLSRLALRRGRGAT
ncbi:hypothetical protein M885DRAFT_514737 [Pelagophyceae sp. CCMP2097]|nr:hypothetical protein M885DRAFT_514737 [Pelagophyceae sp. CCMP2097]